MRRTHKLALSIALAVMMLGTLAATGEAQRGRSGGHPGGGGRGAVFVGSYWSYPYWGWGWDPYWWGGPYGYRYPVGRYYYGDDDGRASSVRLQVTPKDAQVYLDGYFAGSVDDFDGVFQRLRVRPGAHEIVLYLKGYHTIRQTLDLKRGEDYRIRHEMTSLAAGETNEPPPQPPARPAAQVAPMEPGEPRQGNVEPPRGYRPPRRMPAEPGGAQAQGFGALVIRVQPGGAEVLIDGERWQGPDGQDRLGVQVPEGMHRVEIRKEGFSPFSSNVNVRTGETVPVNVSLAKTS